MDLTPGRATVVAIRPGRGGAGATRWILRRNIELAYALRRSGQLQASSDLRRGGVKTANPSYILAILEAAEWSAPPAAV